MLLFCMYIVDDDDNGGGDVSGIILVELNFKRIGCTIIHLDYI